MDNEKRAALEKAGFKVYNTADAFLDAYQRGALSHISAWDFLEWIGKHPKYCICEDSYSKDHGMDILKEVNLTTEQLLLEYYKEDAQNRT
jgi:hypothetical protein